MDRRDFIKSGAIGLAGLAAGQAVPWLSPEAAMAHGSLRRQDGKPWKFGVMADTQWKANLDGQNPGTCAVGIINALNAQFIQHKVDFVIQVGDLIDVETDGLNGASTRRNMPVRAQAAGALYEAGIGFYPLRGNHEASVTAANEFWRLYPQTRGFGKNVFGADHFSSPFESLDGLSYSFDWGNGRFILFDQFVRIDGTVFNGTEVVGNSSSATNNVVDQIPWFEQRLASRKKGTHAFAFAHKNLVGQNHRDVVFGNTPQENAAARDAFIGAADKYDLAYYMSGHDHMHNRSIITSPDGTSSVKQLVASSNSYKFYVPANPANEPALELVQAQEAFSVGYYIYTVDGPRVTVDFYSSTHGQDFGDIDLTATPAMAFCKRETWGYSLNGEEFVIPQGGDLSVVADAFEGTYARILAGTNESTATDTALRPLVKNVNTGWANPGRRDDNLASNVLSLWGLADDLALWDQSLTGLLPDSNRTRESDTYVLALTYDGPSFRGAHFSSGKYGMATRAENGTWVKAVDKNFGGTPQFVVGPWGPSYGLGTYGVDPYTRTAWAVLNYDGDFAVAKGI